MLRLAAHLRTSRIHLFAALLLGLGLGASLTLDFLWCGLRRENLPGIEPVREIFSVELTGSNNQESLGREDAERVVAAAVPGADVVTVRRVEADVEAGGQRIGMVKIALVPDRALDLLGIAIGRGRIPELRGSGPSRQLVMSDSFATRLAKLNLSELGVLKLKSRGVVGHDAVGFQPVGVTAMRVHGLTHEHEVELWIGEREWPNWLLAADVPERILDVVFPVENLLVLPRETIAANTLASRLQRASQTLGLPVTAHVVEGTARDPSTTPRIQAQTLIHSTLAISMLAICVVGALFLWALALVRSHRELQIRAMLGESLARSRIRLAARSALSILFGIVVSIALAFLVLRILATIEPYRSFSLGPWFLAPGEFLDVALRSVSVPLSLMLIQLFAAEVVLRRVLQHRLSAAATGRAPLAGLIAFSSGVSVVACTVAAIAFLGQYRAEMRDFGFPTANLLEVAVVRSDEQLVDAAFDARPAIGIIEAIRERLQTLGVTAQISASSVHPLQKSTTIEYALNDDPPGRRRWGNVVRVDARFFMTLGVPLRGSTGGGEPLLPPDRVLIDEAFARTHADTGKGSRTFRLFDMDTSLDPMVSVDGIVPSLFHDGATGPEVPSIYRALTRRGDVQWIWIRTDGHSPVRDIEKVIAQSFEEFGLPFKRVEVRTFSDALRERLLVQWTERNTALTASLVLLALSVITTFALFAFAGRSRAREFALRLALGATPIRAMFGLMRSGIWTPMLGLGAGWLVAGSATMPALTLLGLSRADLVAALLTASFATGILLFVGLVSTVRTVARASLRETLAET